MDPKIAMEMSRHPYMTVQALRLHYAELFGEWTGAGNKDWLIKRIAWRLQALAEGDLSARARMRARELACDADLRLSPPQDFGSRLRTIVASDPRLPSPGSTLVRKYRGQVIKVKALFSGLEYQGTTFESLSAVATAITGAHWNGMLSYRQ
jgi:hypothetical protein